VFAVQVEDVLKNASQLSLTASSLIEVEHEGGRVKFPSGRIHLYMTNEQDMPHVGSRYVLFLSDDASNPVFQIITGYELCEGKI